MVVIKNPLNRNQIFRVNDRYDNSDFIVPNSVSETKQFKDLPKVSQLTQNEPQFSPYTRENVYKDIQVNNPETIPRMKRYEGILKPEKHHDH
tara:strand:+ start:444 stop:719 length:276 start_codon:yes stop_codon:yes gene_type:complete